MSPSPRIAPSILSADFGRLAESVRVAEAAGADWIHVDVMDGHFVPNLTFGALAVAAVRPVTRLPLDVHLMVERPESLVPAFAQAGADCITVHAEASQHLQRLLAQIRGLGVKAGLALNPATSEEVVRYLWDDLDLILVMTVNPGFGGQAFLTPVVEKLRRLAAERRQRAWQGVLEVDGGVTPETAPLVVAAGADVLVAGSAVYGDGDLARVPERLAALRAAAVRP